MENFFSRHKNPFVLILVLFVQVIALATQVKRPENPRSAGPGGPTLIRVWTINLISPFERGVVGTGHFFRRTWSNYIDLHNVRKENRELQEEIGRLKLEQVRLRDDADQAHRLQALLEFKQHYVGQTLAAQVIGSSGSEQSHVIYIDKGSASGIKPDMPVITPDGIVGKTKDVTRFNAQVLMINDRESGAGVILTDSRLQGVLRGVGQGELQVSDIMSDEKVEPGEQVVTSGGDRIYPKGLPVGTVSSAVPDAENDPFLKITVKPAANLSRLEEVLVVTQISEELPSKTAGSATRAADILAQRLPSIEKSDAGANKAATTAATPKPAGATATTGKTNAAGIASGAKPAEPGAKKTGSETALPKPGATAATPGTPAGAAATTGKTNAAGTASGAKTIEPGAKKTGLETAQPKPDATPANGAAGVIPRPTPTNGAAGPKAKPTPTPSTALGGSAAKTTPTPSATASGSAAKPNAQASVATGSSAAKTSSTPGAKKSAAGDQGKPQANLAGTAAPSPTPVKKKPRPSPTPTPDVNDNQAPQPTTGSQNPPAQAAPSPSSERPPR